MEPSLLDVSRDILLYGDKKLASHIQGEATHMKLRFSVPQKVASGMDWLASLVLLHCVAELFEVDRSSTGHAFYEVVGAICAAFQHLQESQPDQETVRKRLWTKYSFLMCVGAIGSTHI